MAKSIFYLLLTIAILEASSKASESVRGHCDDATWVKYEDTKCYKLLDRFLTWDEATSAWQQFSGKTPSKLVQITSIHEQKFLTQFLFNASNVIDNIWLGAMRHTGKEFIWTDGVPLQYTNWAMDHPTNESGRDCVEMISGWTKDIADSGKWKDVNYDAGLWAVCEKSQVWDAHEMQQAILALRNNPPVPLGLLYTKISGQPSPQFLWPNFVWTDVSGDYAGLFFRINGGDAAQFGSRQGDSTRQINNVEFNKVDWNSNYPWAITVPPTGWSPWVSAGYDDASDHGVFYYHGMRFQQNQVEVRPVNTAVRLWKRTA